MVWVGVCGFIWYAVTVPRVLTSVGVCSCCGTVVALRWSLALAGAVGRWVARRWLGSAVAAVDAAVDAGDRLSVASVEWSSWEAVVDVGGCGGVRDVLCLMRCLPGHW